MCLSAETSYYINRDKVSASETSSEDSHLEPTDVEVEFLELRSEEVVQLRTVVSELHAQLKLLMSYLGVTETEGRRDHLSHAATTADKPDKVHDDVGLRLLRPDETCTEATLRPASLYRALKQAVMSAVYTDFDEYERRNKNVVNCYKWVVRW